MFDALLNDRQYNYAIRRATEYANRFGDHTSTDAFTPDKWLVGECGEIAFALFCRHHSIRYQRMPVGHGYDFEVNASHIEIATHDRTHEHRWIVRKPDKVERNNASIDIYVGVSRVRYPNHYQVYGWCTADQMDAAPLRRFRSDLPPMKAVDDWQSTTSLLMQFTDNRSTE